MKPLVVGIGGMTNGGKSTLANRLHQTIPHSCVIAQDTFFKEDSEVPVDSNGFKQYDMLSALRMDEMTAEVTSWSRDPESRLSSRGLTAAHVAKSDGEKVFVLVVEGFLIFNHRPLNELMDKRYFMEIPYDECKRRRCSRVYSPPDPPGYFDGHVWPMYLVNRREMEAMVPEGVVLLDGLKPKEELLAAVFRDITEEIEKLRGKD